MKGLLNVFLLLFRDKAFVREATEHDTPENKEADKQPETIEQRVAWKRKAIRSSFLGIVVSAILGFVIAHLVNSYCPVSLNSARIIRVVSISIIAWALLAKLTNNVDTMWGRTLLEKTNDLYFKVFYSIGFLLAAFSLFLDPIDA